MMMVAAFAVATSHALVLTVSHDCYSANPLIFGSVETAVATHTPRNLRDAVIRVRPPTRRRPSATAQAPSSSASSHA